MTAVFDGHNDALGELQSDDGAPEDFLTGLPGRDIDLPRARAGGLAGGLFAINAPSPHDLSGGGSLWDMPYAEPIVHAQATAFTAGAVGRAHRLAAARNGAVAVVTDGAALDRCRADGTLAVVLHLEGAEAIDPGLSALDAWHAAGVRSLGPVWSRPNAFGHGVPFRFPASPDTGPGLTAAGLALVHRCAQLGILVDVSHLNAAGFADVARLAAGPVVASHTACHALSASTRNLTDDQLREVGRSDGIAGIVFAPAFLREDGANDADMPLAVLVAHVRHAAALAGIDHVGLGSDFDGAPMPAAIGDVAGLPRVLGALRDDGFTADEVQRIAWGNWRRVLGAVWSS
ncbi:MAG TPA: dipeptidase [Solirubrobacteraceae bacterium]|nr:dipeptidase [Solirubrobacteraceae bacterium]